MSRVLLISPLPGIDPPCGDVTYSEGLLAHPPAGVEYRTYVEALADGTLVERGRRGDLLRSRGLRKPGAAGRILRERVINELRRRGLLFREPFRHFAVAPGVYDVVHCHVFSASFGDLDAALVTSNAAPIEDLYLGARRWSPRRVRLAALADKVVARLQHVQHTSSAMPRADVVVAFTQTLRDELVRRGSAPADRILVAPCFVGVRDAPDRERPPHVVGFVATDFEAKGGPTVLAAFEEVRRRLPDAELVVIGSEPRLTDSEQRVRGIRWIRRVPRDELLNQHLPGLDVFAYPTESDGLPLAVLEVMSLGTPVVTSDFGAMPEVVGNGSAGRVVPQRNPGRLASEVLDLLRPDVHAAVSVATREWFGRHYDTPVAIGGLGEAYAAAIRRRDLDRAVGRRDPHDRHHRRPAGRERPPTSPAAQGWSGRRRSAGPSRDQPPPSGLAARRRYGGSREPAPGRSRHHRARAVRRRRR